MLHPRVLSALFATLMAGAVALPAAAQTYPSQPIKIIVPTAPGGVADTIRARCEKPDSLCDARLESVPRALFRYAWRRRLRRLHAAGRLGTERGWARALRIPEADAARVAAHPLAGHAVAEAERASPRLVHRPLGPRQLPAQIRVARAVLPLVRLVTRFLG